MSSTLDGMTGIAAPFRRASRMVPPVLFTAPATEPLDVSDLRAQCRIDGSDEDTTLLRYLKVAREKVEADCEIALITQTWIQYLDWFPCDGIELRRPPIQSITSITYTDTNGVSQTLSASNYEVDIGAKPGVVIPSYGNSWPSARAKLRSVAVKFVCGYGAASAVPESLKQAILLRAASLYWSRELSKHEEQNYEALLEPYRWRRFQ